MDESLLELSDDEFLQKMSNPDALASAVEDKSGEETPSSTETTEETTKEEVVETGSEETAVEENTETTDTTTTDEVKEGGEEKTEEVDTTATTEETAAEINYKQFYDSILAQPIKANGKEIQLTSAEEVVQLLQMGANYTKKMQAIAPHRKILGMLESQNLLDVNELNYLIELKNKNPQAIAKLVKDAGIDPRDIDTEVQDFTARNYSVSDNEIEFKAHLDDLKSSPEGNETLHVINSTWDDESMGALLKEPDLINTIHEQMNTGVYQMIVGEIDRQKLFNKIKAGTPFLAAYSAVGSELEKKGSFEHLKKTAQATTVATKTPVALTTSQPKTPVTNNDKANAAAINRSKAASTAKPIINPLAMSDDEFLKQFKL